VASSLAIFSRRLQPKEEPTMNTPADVIPDELVLAAIERAERHRARDTPGVPVWAITDHLDIPRRSGLARRVRARLDALEVAGSLERSRRHGVPTWALASAGRRRLQRARRAGNVPALPESPQHRAWRNARTAATQEIERFRPTVRDCLGEAALLLDADPPASSDAWFELGERLQRACRRLGSASYCVDEWAEPDDARADIDDHRDPADKGLDRAERARRSARRAGRRNISLWETSAPGADGGD
jgi:hypothetical protein